MTWALSLKNKGELKSQRRLSVPFCHVKFSLAADTERPADIYYNNEEGL